MEQGVSALKELPSAMKKRAGALMSGNITVEVIRGLKTMITPLGGNDTLPKRQTLTDWWK